MTHNPAQKVMFVCPNLETGGAERQWAILIRGLFEQGFDVSVMTLDGRGAYFDELRAGGVPIACAALRHRADPVGLARAAWLGRSRLLRVEDGSRSFFSFLTFNRLSFTLS